MKIRKFVALVICPVVLTLLLSPVSFAYTLEIQGTSSPLDEPVASFQSMSNFTLYWVAYGTNLEDGPYRLFKWSVTSEPNNSFYLYNGRLYGLNSFSVVEDSWNIVTGVYQSNILYPSRPTSYPYDGKSNVVTSAVSQVNQGLYPIYPSQISLGGGPYSSPFVEWSISPQEHNTYHSELSEPVADEYNSYFICNDKLYWLSYRANGLYSYNQNVEVSSVVSSESASYGSSGSGSYSGQSGGQTETVTAPYVIVSGSVSNGEVFNGSASSPNFGQIDYVGSSQGNLSFSQNGNITYNSVYVYPVSISNQLLNRLFDVVIYLTDNSGFKVWLVPRSDLGQSLILDASLYCSAFDLTNGEYLSSSFSSYTGSYQYAGFDYPLSEPISDVRCYGCAFYNLNNIPVNLSDVLWQYDLSFVLWREDVLQKLNDIYNVLSEAESITSYQAPDLASKMDDENIINDLSYNSGDVQQDLNDNIDRGIQALGSDGGQLQSLTSQIIGLGNGKIFSLLIISLSLGILILILGKNKND